MTTSTIYRPNLTGLFVVAFILLGICGIRIDMWALARPYPYSIGGKPASGGTAATGGATTVTGGTLNSGGFTAVSGGAPSSGGATAVPLGGRP